MIVEFAFIVFREINREGIARPQVGLLPQYMEPEPSAATSAFSSVVKSSSIRQGDVQRAALFLRAVISALDEFIGHQRTGVKLSPRDPPCP